MQLRQVADGWQAPAIWLNAELERADAHHLDAVFALEVDRYRPERSRVKLQIRKVLFYRSRSMPPLGKAEGMCDAIHCIMLLMCLHFAA